jgi:hypothetical protein
VERDAALADRLQEVLIDAGFELWRKRPASQYYAAKMG